MAEEAPAIRNKWLLIVAVALAVIVVILYNVHVSSVRREAQGEQVTVLEYNYSLSPGDVIKEKALGEKRIPRDIVRNMPNIVKASDKGVIKGRTVNRRVSKGDFVYHTHTTLDQRDLPSMAIEPQNMVAVPIAIDPRQAPGTILRVGDRVNILGRISLNKGKARTYRIVECVKVLGIGGRGLEETTGRGGAILAERGQRSYRSITVQLLPDESVKLSDVLANVLGSPRIEVRNPQANPPARAGIINPELSSLYQKSTK